MVESSEHPGSIVESGEGLDQTMSESGLTHGSVSLNIEQLNGAVRTLLRLEQRSKPTEELLLLLLIHLTVLEILFLDCQVKVAIPASEEVLSINISSDTVPIAHLERQIVNTIQGEIISSVHERYGHCDDHLLELRTEVY